MMLALKMGERSTETSSVPLFEETKMRWADLGPDSGMKERS